MTPTFNLSQTDSVAQVDQNSVQSFDKESEGNYVSV